MQQYYYQKKELETPRKVIYRIDPEEDFPPVNKGDLVIVITGSGETVSVNRYLRDAAKQKAQIVAITAKPEAQIWQEVKPAAIIHIIGETKIKEAESSAEHSEEVLRFKKAAPMGTSFELSAGLYLLSMIECLVKGVVTKADLQRKIKRYFEKVSKAVESNNFKMNLSEDKISKIAYLISEVKYTPRAKIYISGDGVSHKIALLFMTRLRQLEIPVEVAGMRHVQTRLRKDDLAIIIGAYTKEDRLKAVIDTAREVGAKRVLITASGSPELEDKVDVTFTLQGTMAIPSGLDFAQLLIKGIKPFKPGSMLFWTSAWLLTEGIISQLGEVKEHVQWQLEYPAFVSYLPYAAPKPADARQQARIIEDLGAAGC